MSHQKQNSQRLAAKGKESAAATVGDNHNVWRKIVQGQATVIKSGASRSVPRKNPTSRRHVYHSFGLPSSLSETDDSSHQQQLQKQTLTQSSTSYLAIVLAAKSTTGLSSLSNHVSTSTTESTASTTAPATADDTDSSDSGPTSTIIRVNTNSASSDNGVEESSVNGGSGECAPDRCSDANFKTSSVSSTSNVSSTSSASSTANKSNGCIDNPIVIGANNDGSILNSDESNEPNKSSESDESPCVSSSSSSSSVSTETLTAINSISSPPHPVLPMSHHSQNETGCHPALRPSPPSISTLRDPSAIAATVIMNPLSSTVHLALDMQRMCDEIPHASMVHMSSHGAASPLLPSKTPHPTPVHAADLLPSRLPPYHNIDNNTDQHGSPVISETTTPLFSSDQQHQNADAPPVPVQNYQPQQYYFTNHNHQQPYPSLTRAQMHSNQTHHHTSWDDVEDASQTYERQVLHSRYLWGLMCSTMIPQRAHDGSPILCCQDVELFENCAVQHQRLTLEQNMRSPHSFVVRRDMRMIGHCACGPTSLGCGTCWKVFYQLDDHVCLE